MTVVTPIVVLRNYLHIYFYKLREILLLK